MKDYVKPTMCCLYLKVEERFAGSPGLTGSCLDGADTPECREDLAKKLGISYP